MIDPSSIILGYLKMIFSIFKLLHKIIFFHQYKKSNEIKIWMRYFEVNLKKKNEGQY